MATKSKQTSSTTGDLLSELPLDRLKDEVVELGKAVAQRGITKIGERMSGATDKLGDLAPGPGDVVKAVAKAGSPVAPVKNAASKVKDALPGVGSDDDSDDSGGTPSNSVGDDTDLKVTNIVESIDVPVSREIAYELWTQFEEFPSFMKKVENVSQKDPEVVTWKAQIFWSHRTWTAKIVDQVPPERIVWKSEAEKGKVDGAVTFHEIAPDLTRVLVSLEYHPQGLFERTGNLWRAQGRRVRVELKHFRRHVANHALINQDEVDGWDGEIHDGKVKPRRRSSSGARKTSAKKTSARKTSASRSTSGSASSGSTGNGTAKKSASSSSSARKSTSRGSAAKKTTAKKSAARKSPAKKTAAKKTTAKRSPAKKSTARKTTSSGSSKRAAAASKRSSTTSARASSSRKSAPRKRTGSGSRSSRTKS